MLCKYYYIFKNPQNTKLHKKHNHHLITARRDLLVLVASNFCPELIYLKSIEMLFQKSSRTIKLYSEMAVGFPVRN